MSNVVSMPAKTVTFDVQVTRDAESGWYMAVCDELCVVTEARGLEALIARVWEIAPEMAQENGLHIATDALRLRFSYVDQAPALQAM